MLDFIYKSAKESLKLNRDDQEMVARAIFDLCMEYMPSEFYGSEIDRVFFRVKDYYICRYQKIIRSELGTCYNATGYRIEKKKKTYSLDMSNIKAIKWDGTDATLNEIKKEFEKHRIEIRELYISNENKLCIVSVNELAVLRVPVGWMICYKDEWVDYIPEDVFKQSYKEE